MKKLAPLVIGSLLLASTANAFTLPWSKIKATPVPQESGFAAVEIKTKHAGRVDCAATLVGGEVTHFSANVKGGYRTLVVKRNDGKAIYDVAVHAAECEFVKN